MGRFYQTDKPVFVDDVIYKPNLDLAAKLLLQKEKEFQAQEAIADKLYNINFNYLNSEEDKANAERIKSYFKAKSDDLIRRMQSDPMNYMKYQNELRALTREYTQSKTSGDISKLEGSYNAYNSWDKVNEEICKKQPALCTALKNEAWNKWGGNSINRQWNQERALQEIDWKEIEKNIQALEADIISKSTLTDAGYIYRIDEEERKFLSREDIRNYAKNVVMSNPEYMAYMKQSDRVGQSSYLDAFGNMRTGGTLDTKLQGLESYAYEQYKHDLNVKDDTAQLEMLKSNLRMQEEEAKRKAEEVQRINNENLLIVPYDEKPYDINKFGTNEYEGYGNFMDDLKYRNPEEYNTIKQATLNYIDKEYQSFDSKDIWSLWNSIKNPILKNKIAARFKELTSGLTLENDYNESFENILYYNNDVDTETYKKNLHKIKYEFKDELKNALHDLIGSIDSSGGPLNSSVNSLTWTFDYSPLNQNSTREITINNNDMARTSYDKFQNISKDLTAKTKEYINSAEQVITKYSRAVQIHRDSDGNITGVGKENDKIAFQYLSHLQRAVELDSKIGYTSGSYKILNSDGSALNNSDIEKAASDILKKADKMSISVSNPEVSFVTTTDGKSYKLLLPGAESNFNAIYNQKVLTNPYVSLSMKQKVIETQDIQFNEFKHNLSSRIKSLNSLSKSNFLGDIESKIKVPQSLGTEYKDVEISKSVVDNIVTDYKGLQVNKGETIFKISFNRLDGTKESVMFDGEYRDSIIFKYDNSKDLDDVMNFIFGRGYQEPIKINTQKTEVKKNNKNIYI